MILHWHCSKLEKLQFVSVLPNNGVIWSCPTNITQGDERFKFLCYQLTQILTSNIPPKVINVELARLGSESLMWELYRAFQATTCRMSFFFATMYCIL